MYRMLRAAVAVGVLALAGCGGGAAKPHPSSAAKHRYLAHFNGGSCASANREAASVAAEIQRLTGRIARGDRRAVTELARYLNGLAAGYERELRLAAKLGPPPPPDAADGAAYLHAAQVVASAIAQIASAVESGNAAAIAPAESAIASATRTASAAAKRYGFQQCGSGQPPGPSVSA